MTEPYVCGCVHVCVRAFVNGLSRVGMCIKVIAMEIGERVNEQDRVRKLERDGGWRKRDQVRRREILYVAVLLSGFQARECFTNMKTSHRSCSVWATLAGTFQRIKTHAYISRSFCLTHSHSNRLSQVMFFCPGGADIMRICEDSAISSNTQDAHLSPFFL